MILQQPELDSKNKHKVSHRIEQNTQQQNQQCEVVESLISPHKLKSDHRTDARAPVKSYIEVERKNLYVFVKLLRADGHLFY